MQVEAFWGAISSLRRNMGYNGAYYYRVTSPLKEHIWQTLHYNHLLGKDSLMLTVATIAVPQVLVTAPTWMVFIAPWVHVRRPNLNWLQTFQRHG